MFNQSINKTFAVLFIILMSAILTLSCSDEKSTNSVNQRPETNPDEVTESAGGERYVYHHLSGVPEGMNPVITFQDYPEWLTPDADSIYGTTPENFSGGSFMVITSYNDISDTIRVLINAENHIIVYGDSRTGHAYHQEIVDRIRRHRPTAIFHSGDLVNNGLLQSDWDMFFSITEDMLAFTDFYPALGNHENQSPLFFEYFDLPGNEQWYSVDINKTHFIVLNSCIEYHVGSEQYQWLEQDLMAVPDTMNFIAVVFHHPPFSTGSHDDEHNLQASFVPLFEQYGVDIVFNGHNHCYERLYCNGIYYIVTGGGGAPLHDQVRELECSQLYVKSYNYCKLWYNDNGILIRVYDNNDELIDRFQLTAD